MTRQYTLKQPLVRARFQIDMAPRNRGGPEGRKLARPELCWNQPTAGDQPPVTGSPLAVLNRPPRLERQCPWLHPPARGPCALHPGVAHAGLKRLVRHDANHNHHQALFSNPLGQETTGALVSPVWGLAIGECHRFLVSSFPRPSSLLLRFGFNPTRHRTHQKGKTTAGPSAGFTCCTVSLVDAARCLSVLSLHSFLCLSRFQLSL